MATTGDVSGLDILIYGGKPMVPLTSGFSRRRQSGVISSDTSGGASRQRKKYYGGTHIVTADFYLETAQQQDYMELFVSRNEGKRFICHLAADRPLVEAYVVQIIGDVEYTEVNAKESRATMTMEVFSVREQSLDDYLYENYQVMGDSLYNTMKGLHEIVEEVPIDD